MKKIIILFTLFLSVFAKAEDTSFINLLGFSDDGAYMAFQEAIWMDGAGNYYSMIRVLDVKQDIYVNERKNVVDEIELNEMDEAGVPHSFAKHVSDSQNAAADMLNFYGIKKSNGEYLHISVAPRLSGLTYQGKFIGLQMINKPVEMNNEDPQRVLSCQSWGDDKAVPEPGHLLGYEIQGYSYQSMGDNFNGTIHNDSRIPRSRGCPTAYSLNTAVAFNDTVVLLISYTGWGFEGPDTQFITAPLKLENF